MSASGAPRAELSESMLGPLGSPVPFNHGGERESEREREIYIYTYKIIIYIYMYIERVLMYIHTYMRIWSMYYLGIVVGYRIWPYFYGSYTP